MRLDKSERKPWEPMRVTGLGQVKDLVQTGEGKFSDLLKGDPGEPMKKPPGEQ